MISHGHLTVTVEDSNAKAVRGATVILLRQGAKKGIRLVKTIVPGQYTVSTLELGVYRLRVSKRNFETETYELELSSGANSFDVVLGKRGEPFFFADSKKIYFTPSETQFLLYAAGGQARSVVGESLEAFTLRHERVVEDTVEIDSEDAFFERVYFPSEKPLDSKTIQDVVRRLEDKGFTVRPALIIQRGDGPPQGLTNELVVQFEPEVSEEEATRVALRYGLEIKRRVLSLSNTYLLSTNRAPSYDILDTARQLLEKVEVRTAEPDLLMQLELDQYTPNDPLFNLLNHLTLINCDDAWEFLGNFLGNDWRGGDPTVCIAVFDSDGVAPNHADLIANLSNAVGKLVDSFDFRNMAIQTVGNLRGDHGTQCAGTATAAFDNNQGICGVAPNCGLIGARLPHVVTGVDMADAFLWAAGIDNGNTNPNFPAFPAQPADVISNSWGANNAALTADLRAAFDRLTDDGRNGRGVFVTFSTGNLGYVQFSNIRRFAAYNRTIAVGASINANPTSPVNSTQPDPNGNTTNIAVAVDTRALYNPFGPEMDIVAPSHTCYQTPTNLVDPTTSSVRVGTGALDGCPGPQTCLDYDTSFGGTSHASPTIAGVAALILTANSTLSWEEVRDVLRRTAVRIDAGQANVVGQWIDNDGDGDAEFSQWYGYGRVDVNEAVHEAAKLYVAEHNLISYIGGV